MISSLGHLFGFTTSQTLNKQTSDYHASSTTYNTRLLVGRVLVSRTDNVGKTVSIREKRPSSSSSRNLKGVILLRQQLDGHGSRQSLRRV